MAKAPSVLREVVADLGRLVSAEGDMVADLARRVDRLGQRRTDPERFHVEKSEIAKELRAVAERLAADPRRQPSTTWRA